LDVLQQVGGGTVELIGRARTGANGTFVASVPAGPSRMVEIGYRAFSGDVDYSARAKLVESVDAGVQLRVSPRRTGAEGTIALSGRVLGPIPPQGVVVELLVHYRGRWEPFRDPRTDSCERFRVVYCLVDTGVNLNPDTEGVVVERTALDGGSGKTCPPPCTAPCSP
jgi:hypothetical protein